jgi:hypothetical protein
MSSLRRTPKERRKIPPDFLYQAGSSKVPQETDLAATGVDSLPEPLDLWNLFSGEPGSHIDTTNTNPLWTPTPLSQLQAFITTYSSPDHTLLPPETPTLPLFIADRLLGPVLSHGALVSKHLVSLYLDDLSLLSHFDILKAYFLGGDVDFSQRVTAALFGRDEAGAGEAMGEGKRARTRARLGLPGGGKGGEVVGEWGIGLGLGLSERARWPPGGAELAYALRTTLIGDERSVKSEEEVWDEVEDRVSFAVRDLPEDDVSGRRARWMNPQGKLFLYCVGRADIRLAIE